MLKRQHCLALLHPPTRQAFYSEFFNSDLCSVAKCNYLINPSFLRLLPFKNTFDVCGGFLERSFA